MAIRRQCHGPLAYTMVEVIVAVGIFGITMIGILPAASGLLSTVKKTESRLYVSRILESRLEELRDLTFYELGALPAEIDFEVLPATTAYGKTVNPDVVDAEYQVALTDISGEVFINTLAADLISVSVKVTWKPALKVYEVSMDTTTYITRSGINRQ